MAKLRPFLLISIVFILLISKSFTGEFFDKKTETKSNPSKIDSVTIMTMASISKYVATGNKMALSKEYPYDGCAAVSDRTIPKGSLVYVHGRIYVVKDVTAKWVNDKFGLTIDLYSNESEAECNNFGRKYWPIVIKIFKKKIPQKKSSS